MTFIALALTAPFALAHQPFVVGATADSSAHAFLVEEPDVSIVVYAEPTCEAPEVWLTLDAAPGDEVFVQLGIPVADALDGWRPQLAVVAPGFPSTGIDLPLPDGAGAEIFVPSGEPSRFDEPFSGTSSWILVEERVVLPEGGPAWIVAWNPDGTVARLWVAVGTVERFDAEDWERISTLMDDVRAFHGVDGSEVPGPTECADADEADADAAGDGTDGVASSGCDAGAVGAGAAWAAGALGALLRRRHRSRGR